MTLIFERRIYVKPKSVKNNVYIKRFYFLGSVAVFITWLLLFVFLDLILYLYQNSELGLLESILYFETLQSIIIIGWMILFVIYLSEYFVQAVREELADKTSKVKVTDQYKD